MTAGQFRKLVLGLADTEERAHHHHPDFRVRGKIFATMGYPEASRAMLILTPEQQAEFMHDYPQVFSSAAGAWGRQGSTVIALPKATKPVVHRAALAAHQNALRRLAAKPAARNRRGPSPPMILK